jgi:hypothetical protein
MGKKKKIAKVKAVQPKIKAKVKRVIHKGRQYNGNQ